MSFRSALRDYVITYRDKTEFHNATYLYSLLSDQCASDSIEQEKNKYYFGLNQIINVFSNFDEQGADEGLRNLEGRYNEISHLMKEPNYRALLSYAYYAYTGKEAPRDNSNPNTNAGTVPAVIISNSPTPTPKKHQKQHKKKMHPKPQPVYQPRHSISFDHEMLLLCVSFVLMVANLVLVHVLGRDVYKFYFIGASVACVILSIITAFVCNDFEWNIGFQLALGAIGTIVVLNLSVIWEILAGLLLVAILGITAIMITDVGEGVAPMLSGLAAWGIALLAIFLCGANVCGGILFVGIALVMLFVAIGEDQPLCFIPTLLSIVSFIILIA